MKQSYNIKTIEEFNKMIEEGGYVHPVIDNKPYPKAYVNRNGEFIKLVDSTDKIVRYTIPTRNGTTRAGGYPIVTLDKSRTIHRIVASTFIPNPDNKPEVDHIDGDHFNYKVDNLRWVTHSENMKYYSAKGSTKKNLGRYIIKRGVMSLDGEWYGMTPYEYLQYRKDCGYPITKVYKKFIEKGLI